MGSSTGLRVGVLEEASVSDEGRGADSADTYRWRRIHQIGAAPRLRRLYIYYPPSNPSPKSHASSAFPLSPLLSAWCSPLCSFSSLFLSRLPLRFYPILPPVRRVLVHHVRRSRPVDCPQRAQVLPAHWSFHQQRVCSLQVGGEVCYHQSFVRIPVSCVGPEGGPVLRHGTGADRS